MPLATLITDKSITLFFEKGIVKSITNDSVSFEKVKNLLKIKASDLDILHAIDIASKISEHESGLFSVDDDGTCYISCEKVPTGLGNKIITFAKENLPFEGLVHFWHNVKQNPDERAKTDLFSFLEYAGHPITDDGCFIAYRAVDSNYMDLYTGTISNHVGAIVTKKREECDPDPNVTCSRGLHAASYHYARNIYGTKQGSKLMNVKINPKNVVAIPTDYNNQKMRVCEYEVISENTDGLINKSYFNTSVNYDIIDESHDDTQEDGDESYEIGVDGTEKMIIDTSILQRNRFGDIIDTKKKINTKTIPYQSDLSNDNCKSQKRDSKGRFVRS